MGVPTENRHGTQPSTFKAVHKSYENYTYKIKKGNKLSTGIL